LMDGVTLITATGDRPEAFRLCEFWMSRQSYSGPLQWIVVDDGQMPVKVRRGQQYIRREPRKADPKHTMCANLRLAWKQVRYDNILIIEDDDYYAPNYIETMLSWLQEAELVGEVGAKYYFVRSQQFRVFTEHEHASLCRSGLRRSVLPLMQKLSSGNDWRLDLKAWSQWEGSKYLSRNSSNGDRAISVSMKGMPGRAGVTHRVSPNWTMSDDRDLSQLRTWLGLDHEYYLPYLGMSEIRLPELHVYTVCIGGYDQLQAQPRQDGVSYVAITDGNVVEPWNRIPIEWANGSPRRASRRPKILAHEFFPPDATTLYVDANVRLTDPRGLALAMVETRPEAQLFLLRHNLRKTVAQEAAAVVRMGLDDPKIVRQYITRYDDLIDAAKCLAWGGCILRRPGCELFNQIWWNEYCSGPIRDQLSLSYALWASGVVYCLAGIPYPRGYRHRTPWLEIKRHRKARMQSKIP